MSPREAHQRLFPALRAGVGSRAAQRCLLSLLAGILLLTSWVPVAPAHEVRPAYLRIQQLSDTTYDLLWRVPARGETRLSLYVELPPRCVTQGEVRAYLQDATFVERWVAECPEGLVGETVTIQGLSATLTDGLVRHERLDGTTQVARVTPSMPRFTVTAAESWQQVAATYGLQGVEHILLGIDHLLFVLALLMIVAGWRKLVATVTAFTVAHSLTLGAATLGWVHMPQAPVEAIIALSILFVAAEIVHWRQGKPSLTRERPWLVAFVFGLLHGFGFAGALTDIGLPEHAVPLALLFFNLGVEAGQLLFIAAVFLAWSLLKRVSWPDWAWHIPVYAIGSLAGFWTIERLAGFA
ncbi:MAG: HupE/UreJ family protein [Pseudomonadota bacterium]